jgi:hypothetical protein
MLYREVNPVYSEIHTKPGKAPSMQNVELFNGKLGGT